MLIVDYSFKLEKVVGLALLVPGQNFSKQNMWYAVLSFKSFDCYLPESQIIWRALVLNELSKTKRLRPLSKILIKVNKSIHATVNSPV